MKTDRTRKALSRVLLAAAVAFVICASLAYTFLVSPVGEGDVLVTVRIDPGSDLRAISEVLHRAGVVSYPLAFRWGARAAGLERKLRAGEYDLSPSWKLPELLRVLAEGKSRMLSVTIPEGMTMEQIAERFAAAGVTDGDAFLSAARDRAFLDSLGVPGTTAEGFLFPETYLFASSSGAEEVVEAMVGQFWKVFHELETQRPMEKLDLLELATLASIVERETAMPEERPLVAAVFLNRLRLGYRLQSDPTVIYGLEDFDGNLTRRDLEAPSPYNTYLIRGLPPGPIANPGRGSLWAVLDPARVDYLYFVSRNDGSHHFSSTLAEHNRAVRQYQMARNRQ